MTTAMTRGMWMVALAAAWGASPVNAGEPCDSPLDLTGWSLFDPDNDWGFSNPTPTSIRLDEQDTSPEVHPGWVVSDFVLAPTATIEFDLQVQNSSGDDDFIGFGFSWLDGSHSYLMDWKKGTQSFNWGDDGVVVNDDAAEAGLKIKRIDGSYTWDGLWGGSDGAGVTTIAGPAGGGWSAGTTYHFVVELEPGRIIVTRDGAPLFDVMDASYAGGAGSIALYGFSQDNLILSEVCITPNPTTADACPADLNDDGVVDGADLGLLLANWDGPGASDIDQSGFTDGADLGLLLASWGDCPT